MRGKKSFFPFLNREIKEEKEKKGILAQSDKAGLRSQHSYTLRRNIKRRKGNLR